MHVCGCVFAYADKQLTTTYTYDQPIPDQPIPLINP